MTKLVNIPLERLIYGGENVIAAIEEAFGQFGLGAVTVSGVPRFIEERKRLLEMTPHLANLPDSSLRKLEDPQSSYLFGWSCGKESMQTGQTDSLKGSFYANPLVDSPDHNEEMLQKYPAYFRPNIWPKEALPELEPAFKALSGTIVDVGLLLLEQCDRYIASKCLGSKLAPRSLQKVVKASHNHKARLLHYFPAVRHSDDVAGAQDQQWCGWHTDNGSLTGLTSAMYIKDEKEIENPDPESGLYIRDRSGGIVKAGIPQDHIAFQVGEALQIQSGGLLMATPHYVKAASGHKASEVSRSTLAVFMQPGVLEPLTCPKGMSSEEAAVGEWQPGMNYGEFAEATFRKNYR